MGWQRNANLLEHLLLAKLCRARVELENPGIFDKVFKTIGSAVISRAKEHDLSYVLQNPSLTIWSKNAVRAIMNSYVPGAILFFITHFAPQGL